MGFLSALSRLLPTALQEGGSQSRGHNLPHASAALRTAPLLADTPLAVHPTGPLLVVVVGTSAAAQGLREAAAAGTAVGLRGAECTAYFLPDQGGQSPVHDPKVGWIIPVDEQERNAIASRLPESGELEVSARLAIAVEA